jgi:threonine/homoserine/homoserine lactone efflux protein
MKSQLIIVVIGIAFLVWCGSALGRWANAQVEASEAQQTRIAEVLR